MHPILILLVGMALVLAAILLLRLNAFLALVGAAIAVTLLSPGDSATNIARVADGFGRTAGSVGIVIALAAIIGTAMTGSGAADRVVNAFLSLLGERRAAAALGSTAFLLSLPVFFDTVFFLLAPLARSMYARTNREYLRYLLAMSASGVATHTLVPPHPGPLAVADTLGVDLGLMILMGVVVALPAALVGTQFARWMDRRMPVPMRPLGGGDAGDVATPAPTLGPAAPPPGLVAALLPVVMPVLLIASSTVVDAIAGADPAHAATWATVRRYTTVIGNPNVALALAVVAAMWLYGRRNPSRAQTAEMVESSLMGAGVVILIVAAGGAFGAALQGAGLGPAIQRMFADNARGSGFALLFLAFGMTSVLKIAQGSSTVAMITTAGMLGAMVKGVALPFHAVYLATAIAAGSLVGSWMNDAGFWVFSKVGGPTEMETLKSWTPLLAIVGVTSMAMTVLLAAVMPMK